MKAHLVSSFNEMAVVADLNEAIRSPSRPSSGALDEDVRQVVKRLVYFSKTHPPDEYKAYLRGFSAGYQQAPSAKKARIGSLLGDLQDSQTAQGGTDGRNLAYRYGGNLGVAFYRHAVSIDKMEALRLLARYYDDAMEAYARLQTFPIVIKSNGSALREIFVSDDIDLLAAATREEFALAFPHVDNTIDVSRYVTVFDEPDFPPQLHNRIDIMGKIFTSNYAVDSLGQDSNEIRRAVSVIMNSNVGTDVIDVIPASPDDIELIGKYLVHRGHSPLDKDYVRSTAQRELDTVLAYDFFVRSAVLLLEQDTRDVMALIFTPLLVNVMASYVDRTTSLKKILRVYAPHRPLDANVRAFLERHVSIMNERWLSARVKIIVETLFSKHFAQTLTDDTAADVAFYLKSPELETKTALVNKISTQHGDAIKHIAADMTIEEYEASVRNIGVGKFMRANTRSLFAWMYLNNQSYWPSDVCSLQNVIHDVKMIRHLHNEMEERAAMVDRILHFDKPGRFTRWDLTDHLARRESENEYDASFEDMARLYVASLKNTPSVSVSSSVHSPYSFASPQIAHMPTDLEVEFETLDSDSDDEGAMVEARAPLIQSSIRTTMSARLDARMKNVVLRDITVLDTPLKVHEDAHFIGAYYGHAYGPFLGSAAYSRTGKRLLSVETSAAAVGTMLGNYINELYPDSNIADELGADDDGEIVVPVEPTHDLVIDATVNYRPNLAGHAHERPHGIYFYLSRGYCPSGPVFVSAEDAMHGRRVQLAYKVKHPEIPGHAMFNVDSYAMATDVVEEECVNQAGFAACRLADVSAGRVVQFKLNVPNSDYHVHKGNVQLTVHSVSLPVRATSTVTSDQQLYSERAHVQSVINSYINANRAFYRQHPNVVGSLQNITVFEYACREGIIPGSMFDVFKLAPSKESYYLQALAFVLRRRRPDVDVRGDEWLAFDQKTKVCILMDVLRLYVNYCTYIRDLVDNNNEKKTWSPANVELIESFDYIRHRDAGDCEDFTREILQSAMELKHNLRDSTSPSIQELRRIADSFVFASILCGVSREAMSLARLSGGSVSLHGHECAVAIPNYIFFEALRRSDATHPALSLYTDDEKAAGQDEQIYVLEGTGCLFPEPRIKSDFVAHVEKAFKRCTSIVQYVEPVVYYHPERSDTFYKQMITVLTPEIFLRTGHMNFEFLVCTRTRDGLKRGVPFALLLDIHGNPNIEIVAAPTVPVEVFRAASRMDDDNFPPIVLEPAAVSAEMKALCEKMTTSRPREGQEVFQFHVKFQRMTDDLSGRIREFAQTNKLQMCCFAEPVKRALATGASVGGYTILMF